MSSFGNFFGNIGNKISQGWNRLKDSVSDFFDPQNTQGFSKYNTFITDDPEIIAQNEENGNQFTPIFDNPLDPRDRIGRKVMDSISKEVVEEGTILGAPATVPDSDSVKDSSDTSLSLDENPANTQSDLQELWDREDSIRKETQEREDTAYQRAVEDMRKAGINPELLGVSPASSGGGITSATRKDYSVFNTLLNNQYELLKQEIQNNFQGSENEKDRILGLLKSVITLAGISSVKLK